MRVAIHRLRVNVKSLAAEARFIRDEVPRARSREVNEALHLHKVLRLKPEARLAHLALAYCKGTPYRCAEGTAKRQPDVRSLAKKINRFVLFSERVSEEQMLEWLEI